MKSFRDELNDYMKENAGKIGSLCSNCGKIYIKEVSRCPRCRGMTTHFKVGTP